MEVGSRLGGRAEHRPHECSMPGCSLDQKTGPDLSVVLKVGFGGRRHLWPVHSCSMLRAGKQASADQNGCGGLWEDAMGGAQTRFKINTRKYQ